MSLEAILEANTAALQSHTAVMQALLERLGAAAPAALETVAAAVEEAKPADAKEEKPAAQGKAKPQAEKPAAQAKPEAEQKAGTAEAVTYDQIKPLIIKMGATKGREAAAELLKEFGVERGPDLKPEQYGAVFTKLQAALS